MYPILIQFGAVLIPAYGAMAALGVLLALGLAQRTGRTAGLNAGAVWNLCVIALFAALVCSRLLLVVVNWSVLVLHPRWLLGLAMVHHPLLASAGALAGLVAAVLFARRQQMPLLATADALAAPLALGLAFEQIGALLAGSGFGTETAARWAVIYTHPLAARWSGTPLGVALHPVQAYAALAYLTLSVFLLVGLPVRRQQGDVTGVGLMGMGVSIFITELWRDSGGRGRVLDGALDGPQIAAVALVVAGGLLLLERKRAVDNGGIPPFRQEDGERMGHPSAEGIEEKSEVADG